MENNVLIIYTIPDCKWCDKAKEVAAEYGYEVEVKDWYEPSMWDWEALIGYVPTTAPQIFLDGEHIGGCTQLIEYLES